MKRIVSLLLLFSISLPLTGCVQKNSPKQQEERPAVAPVEKVEAAFKLRDKKLLYQMYDPTEVVTMYLTVSSGNSSEGTDHTWDEINTYSVYDYDRMGVDRYKVAGLLQVGNEDGLLAGELGFGQTAPNCTVQVRGQSSSRNAQKNYKISIKDNKGDWRGQSTIALNKHYADATRFMNKMSFDLMSGMDEMMSLRTTFVHLYVKDTTAGGNNKFTDYGLYTQVEQLNKTALKAHGLNKDGHLYKINMFEFYRYEDVIKLNTDPSYDEKAFEYHLEVKGDTDHSKLIKMLEALNDYSIPIDDILDKYFDTENLTYWLAFHILMGNTDTQSRNVYIYSPLNSDKWYFYSWDNDSSLSRERYRIRNYSDGVAWETGVSNYWGNILFQRALKSQSFRKALDNAVEDVYSYLTPERVNSMISSYKAVVKPYVFRMPDVAYYGFTSAQYDRIAAAAVSEIQANYDEYYSSYNRPQPFYIATPEKTNDGILYQWDTAFDFKARNITYTLEVARDYSFNNIVLRKEGLIIPEVKGNTLRAGQYFIRVKAFNSDGDSQYAFDYYVTDDGKIYGTKCFYVGRDGRITEDVYVEG